MQESSLFSTPSPAFIVCRLDDDHSDGGEVISYCSFGLHFSNNYRCWASSHVPVGHLKGQLFLTCVCVCVCVCVCACVHVGACACTCKRQWSFLISTFFLLEFPFIFVCSLSKDALSPSYVLGSMTEIEGMLPVWPLHKEDCSLASTGPCQPHSCLMS